jgi:two-component system, chemotaxis family, chemotaxis protein CheY
VAYLDSFRVLLVEDDLSTRKLIKTFCQQDGITNVVEAPNGREAVNLLKSPPKTANGIDGLLARKFSLVISDWYMPEMNGLELLRFVRHESKQKNLPFIFLTSQKEREYFEDAIKEGVTDYLIKPFTREDFHIMIKRVIPDA